MCECVFFLRVSVCVEMCICLIFPENEYILFTDIIPELHDYLVPEVAGLTV